LESGRLCWSARVAAMIPTHAAHLGVVMRFQTTIASPRASVAKRS
jgi:hypothetical protein